MKNISGIRFKLLFLVVSFVFFHTSCRKKLPDITNNAIYVANEYDGSITVIDAVSHDVITTIDLMEHAMLQANEVMFMPHNVQVAPDGKTVWVTANSMRTDREDEMIVIDPVKNKIIERIKLGLDQHLAHVVLDDDSRYAYVTSNDLSMVIRIDAKEMKEVSRYDLGTDRKPHGLRYKNGKLYVANMGGQSISIVNVSTSVITEVPVGGVAVQCAVTPDGNDAYATLYDTKEVVRYHFGSGVLSRLSLTGGSQGPIQIYPTPDNKTLFVCDQGGLSNRPVNNKVYLIDVATFTVTDSITAGNKTHGVVVDEDGKFAYVTNTNDNTVSVINIATHAVVATVHTGAGPNGVSCWHMNGGQYGGQP